jgi:preprotein translocase subunit SecF
MFKPIRFIPDDTKIKFMFWSRYGYFASGLACLASLLLFVFVGLNYGVDFKGGTVFVIRTEQVANLDELRSKVNSLGFGDAELQDFGDTGHEVLIRLPTIEGGEDVQRNVQTKVKEVLGTGVEYLSIDVVGPKVSGELAQQSIFAVLIAIIGILIYIWFRFEWQFAIATVMSLLHDVMLSIGFFVLIRLEFNLQIIAALLTIVGYSLNDTVVVFDRIREYLRKYKQMPLADLIDFSINSVLPRTLLTSVTTLLALIALYIFGGEVLKGFTLAMIWGVIIATYSSIFSAASLLAILGVNRDAIQIQPSGGKVDKKTAAARP